MSRRARAFGAGVCVAGFLLARGASALPPWVERSITLPEHDFAFDVGLGVGHDYEPPVNPTGVGLNLEMAVSPVDRLEIGVRSGIRFGVDGRATAADAYGRLFDRQTFGTAQDVVANPELRVRGALVRTPIFELALEGRVYLPFEQYSVAVAQFGVPLLFHLGRVARIDTGVYVPVAFYTPLVADVSAPFDLWFQVTSRFWLGPMTGVVYYGGVNHADLPLGFGVGYQFLRNFELKSQLLLPGVARAHGLETLGFGIGLEVRIE